MTSDRGETLALDLTLTPELRRAGVAREVVRLVQEARKAGGLEVSDRIAWTWSAVGDTAEALREHAASVAEEVLAVSHAEGQGDGDPSGADDELGLRFWVTRVEQ